MPVKEQDGGAVSSQQLNTMQQTLNQLLQLVTAQQAEQQQLRSEITQLRTELGRVEATRNVAPSWISQLESTFAVYFDRQLKKLDEVNSPSKAQQVGQTFLA